MVSIKPNGRNSMLTTMLIQILLTSDLRSNYLSESGVEDCWKAGSETANIDLKTALTINNRNTKMYNLNVQLTSAPCSTHRDLFKEMKFVKNKMTNENVKNVKNYKKVKNGSVTRWFKDFTSLGGITQVFLYSFFCWTGS